MIKIKKQKQMKRFTIYWETPKGDEITTIEEAENLKKH